MEEFPSGQRGQTVNLLLFSFDGPNPSSSTIWGRHFRCLPHFCQYSCGFAGFLERKIQNDFP